MFYQNLWNTLILNALLQTYLTLVQVIIENNSLSDTDSKVVAEMIVYLKKLREKLANGGVMMIE